MCLPFINIIYFFVGIPGAPELILVIITLSLIFIFCVLFVLLIIVIVKKLLSKEQFKK